MKRILKLFVFLILVGISVTSINCDSITENSGGGNVPGEIVGVWELAEQTGAQYDICPEEVVDFQNNGQAVLSCPGSNAITRNFNINGNVLTYTETSVQYEIELLNNNTNLAMYGINVSRNLLYQKIPTASRSTAKLSSTNYNNSSEQYK